MHAPPQDPPASIYRRTPCPCGTPDNNDFTFRPQFKIDMEDQLGDNWADILMEHSQVSGIIRWQLRRVAPNCIHIAQEADPRSNPCATWKAVVDAYKSKYGDSFWVAGAAA
jgi:hypothetical protein